MLCFQLQTTIKQKHQQHSSKWPQRVTSTATLWKIRHDHPVKHQSTTIRNIWIPSTRMRTTNGCVFGTLAKRAKPWAAGVRSVSVASRICGRSRYDNRGDNNHTHRLVKSSHFFLSFLRFISLHFQHVVGNARKLPHLNATTPEKSWKTFCSPKHYVGMHKTFKQLPKLCIWWLFGQVIKRLLITLYVPDPFTTTIKQKKLEIGYLPKIQWK
jgi:hypothetical protein